MSSHRMLRVRELLKREIGEVIRRELPVSEAGLISVNDVIVSNNLRTARVYVGLLGTADQKKKAIELLQKNRIRLQGLVGKSVILKYTPQLHFVLDDSIERGNKVLQIIEDIEKTLPPDESTS